MRFIIAFLALSMPSFGICASFAAAGIVNYYSVLGLQPGASEDEIKRAYQKATSRLHPDKYPEGPERDKADEAFRDVTLAYRVLSDSDMRNAYENLEETTEDSPTERNYESDDFTPSMRDSFAMYDSLHPRDNERASWIDINSGTLNVNVVGRKHAKPKWPWNEGTSEFMDLRTGWRSKWDGRLDFRVNEYLTFDPIRGTYVDKRMDAIFYPDTNTWRRLDVTTKKFRDVNPKTGLWLDTTEGILTDNSSSKLFEELLNPMNLEEQERILQNANRIQWTMELHEDFRKLATRQLRSIPTSSTMDKVGIRIVNSIFSLPFASEFPELADQLFNQHPSLIWYFGRRYLSKPEWLASPNAGHYLQKYMAERSERDVYWAGVFSEHKNITAAHNFPLRVMAESDWEPGTESFLFYAFESKLDLEPVQETFFQLLTTPAFLRSIISRDISGFTLDQLFPYLEAQGKEKYVAAIKKSIAQIRRPFWADTKKFLRDNEAATQARLRIIEKELSLPRTETKAEKAAREKGASNLSGPRAALSLDCAQLMTPDKAQIGQ